MKRIDANIILRYLLDDHSELSARAADYIDHEQTFVSKEVICEVVYVLHGVYKVQRKELSKLLIDFIELETITMEQKEIIKAAFLTYAAQNIDFVDSILYAYAKVSKDDILSFDKKLNKLISRVK